MTARPQIVVERLFADYTTYHTRTPITTEQITLIDALDGVSEAECGRFVESTDTHAVTVCKRRAFTWDEVDDAVRAILTPPSEPARPKLRDVPTGAYVRFTRNGSVHRVTDDFFKIRYGRFQRATELGTHRASVLEHGALAYDYANNPVEIVEGYDA